MEGDNWAFILGLKKRTRKAFGIRKKEKDNDSTGSPDRDSGSQKKANGALNGFYEDIDWERYNSPEVDDEGYSLRPEEESEEGDILCTASFSEGEEDHRKKFKIKIKPLPSNHVAAVPSVDELKASIGNIALSPSPMGLKRNTSREEIARPRRIIPTLPTVAPTPAPAPQPPSSQQTPVSEDTTALFGPPLDTAFGESKTEVGVFESDAWGIPLSEPESSLTRSFPTGTPPPLPPKIVPPPAPSTGPPSADDAEVSTEADAPTRKPSIADLDNIFGPEQPSSAGEETSDSWKKPAPPQPASPPPPESPAPPLPASPLPPEDPAPPSPSIPSPKRRTPSPNFPASHRGASCTSCPLSVPPAPAPRASTPPAVTPPTEQPAACSVPPSLVLSQEEQAENTEVTQPKEDGVETVPSPTEANQGSRSTPPPPPPPTYREVVSSPGPTSGAGGTNSGSSSPVRPSTPSSVNPTPPPPPPRPSSRPKLPPGKPTIGDAVVPPPPPTVSKELSVSVSEDDAYVDKLPTFERHFDSFAENDQPSLVWFDRGKFYLTFEGCSRGPSPLTMGAQDTLPVAAAFTETVNAFFKGADPSKCVVKIIGEMVLSFPAGITRHLPINPSPAVLTFSITNYSRLEHVLPIPPSSSARDTTTQAKADAKDFWVNMPNLISHLKKVAEQKPQATYYNVDMLKYQVSTEGLQSIPLNLAVSWRCEPTSH
ncbi:hypothetical protein KUCAC02_022451 [Chaenocephalus aceratus]|uniref:Uncharacterized protein n=1 Tax=Chaenocephalus aceratus TaxID=36190 RepID=A0ACB9XN63_CHAAC|nr:hypothetical protein KUCAC02_022451 [Chaenocephalus aceratus]